MSKNYFSKAITWWSQGITFFCPRSLKHLLGLLTDQISIEMDEQQATVKYYSAIKDSWSSTKSFNYTNNAEQIHLMNQLKKWRHTDTDIVLLLADKYILKKSISLPSATRLNLTQALGFELVRITPFDTTTAYFDYTVIEHNKSSDKLHILLLLTPKQVVEPILTKLRTWGVKVNVISPMQEDATTSTFNLLPKQARPDQPHHSDSINLSLTFIAFILVLALLYVPLIQQKQQLDTLEEKIRSHKKVAIQLRKENDAQQSIINQKSFLANKYQNTPTGIKLLNEITKILPDNTWLTRLVINNNVLQLQGESVNATALIQIIESSDLFIQANFVSPLIVSNTSGKDKFHLSATLFNGEGI